MILAKVLSEHIYTSIVFYQLARGQPRGGAIRRRVGSLLGEQLAHEPLLEDARPACAAPTRINTNQHESTRINMNQHESTRINANQHESTRINANQREPTRINANQHEPTLMNTNLPLQARAPRCRSSSRSLIVNEC